MTNRALFLASLSGLTLASCSDGKTYEETEAVATMDIAEPAYAPARSSGEDAMAELAPVAPPPPPGSGQTRTETIPPSASSPVTVAMPQVAYTYAYGFRVPPDLIRPMQEKHADMCEAKGPQVCRIVSMNSGESEGDYAYGSLQIAIASGEARTFGKALTATTEGMKGELVSSSIQGEDLSKRIVDTEARLRARTVLRDRLMEVLRNRKGTVAELVEAERGVAQVNEEIDQARSWLTQMRGRVAYSTMTLEYEAGTPTEGGFLDPIRGAWGSLAAIFGNLIALLMLLVTVVLPMGLLVWGAVRLFKRLGFSTGIGDEGWTRPEEPKAD
ncbi:DUF4349 domain-containing protein [Erythrobacter sp. SD-21]|uniref:DUF4349 domain-containing protein n=1 Tax=Erythrobacter sp. SD-21 TaxID=161528 RepID=UPI000153EE75|nr:DUF4349 domain-containing protein [Erythrobacter sp. SD-21]EDL48895.1 hypothetical protein ED21_24231 [Erythrobacter sp. SD-21]